MTDRIKALAEWMGWTRIERTNGTMYYRDAEGRVVHSGEWYPDYRIQDAWMLVLKLKSLRYHVEVVEWVNGPASCLITSVDPPGNIAIHQYADTAQEAICTAVEKMREVEG